MQSHPEVVAYRARVEACIGERGYRYFSRQEGDDEWMYFEQKLEDAGLGWSDPFEGVDTTGWTEEEWEAAWEEHQDRPLPPEQLAVLAELQEEEIGMAVAYDECGGGWMHEEEVLAPIRIEIERQFLEDHADALAPYEGVFGRG